MFRMFYSVIQGDPPILNRELAFACCFTVLLCVQGLVKERKSGAPPLCY